MGPCLVKKGDEIWILLGCSIPLILRLDETRKTREVVGECYLHGYMNGEILEDSKEGRVRIEDVQLS